MKILIVDDEMMIVKGLLAHIDKMNLCSIHAQGALSGREALEISEYFSPDLVFTDINMPDMDGMELIAHMRKKTACDNYVVFTAYERFDYAQEAIRQQVIDYIVKPINFEIFDSHIYRLLEENTNHNNFENILESFSSLFDNISRTNLSFSLEKMTKFIRKRYTKDISLGSLSIHTGLSESYICMIFKKELGITFLDYVNELRLQEALRLLITKPDISVSEVASRVGYHSNRQFFRLFKEKTGYTPRAFCEKVTNSASSKAVVENP